MDLGTLLILYLTLSQNLQLEFNVKGEYSLGSFIYYFDVLHFCSTGFQSTETIGTY